MKIYIDISNVKFNHQCGHPDLYRPPILLLYDDGTLEKSHGPVQLGEGAVLRVDQDPDARPHVWIELT